MMKNQNRVMRNHWYKTLLSHLPKMLELRKRKMTNFRILDMRPHIGFTAQFRQEQEVQLVPRSCQIEIKIIKCFRTNTMEVNNHHNPKDHSFNIGRTIIIIIIIIICLNLKLRQTRNL